MSGEATSPGQTGGVHIPGHVERVEGDIVGGDKVNHGLDEEKLVAVLERRGVLRSAQTAGLERMVIVSIARRIAPKVEDFNQAVAELDSAVTKALELIARGERGTNHDEFVNRVLKDVAGRVKANDIDGGARALDAALADLDASHLRSTVALLEEGVQLDTLRRDATSAARRIVRLAALEHPENREARFKAVESKYYEWYERGRDKGLNFDLEIAIEIARRVGRDALESGERGIWCNNLGTALATLGARASGTARLNEAVAVFRVALQELPRPHVPLWWAATQDNLGNVLATLGARESSTARLYEAVAAYREALQERTPARVPIDWAKTQNNLGTALRALGERESGTARLDEAIAAFRASLQELPRAHAPLRWAATQNNLGNALVMLGERESGTARLDDAVAAFRAALLERTRAQTPLDWAATQNNLGNALATLGERESGTARLVEAVAAYREALKERTRERVPMQWAGTQNNLGTALKALGERESGTGRLDEAVAAYRAALDEWTPSNAPHHYGRAWHNLERALALLATRRSGAPYAFGPVFSP